MFLSGVLLLSKFWRGKTKGASARSRHVYSKERYDNLGQNLLKHCSRPDKNAYRSSHAAAIYKLWRRVTQEMHTLLGENNFEQGVGRGGATLYRFYNRGDCCPARNWKCLNSFVRGLTTPSDRLLRVRDRPAWKGIGSFLEKFSIALEEPFQSLQCKIRDCVAILNDPCFGLHWVDHVESSIRSLVEGGNCTGHWSEDKANLRSGIVCLFVRLFGPKTK